MGLDHGSWRYSAALAGLTYCRHVPFTLVHPAAVLPLARTPLVASALVAGALAPDLLYFDLLYRAAVSVSGNFTLTLTHSLHAVLWIDPLLALVMLLTWYGVLRRPLLALAPPSLSGRFAPTDRIRFLASPRMLGWVFVSAVLGATTHVLWDGVTNDGGASRLLQYLSTVAGALCLAWWVWRWWHRTDPAPQAAGDCLSRRTRRSVIAALVLLVSSGAVIELLTNGLPGLDATGQYEYVVRSVLVGVANGMAVGMVGYVLAWQGYTLRRAFAR